VKGLGSSYSATIAYRELKLLNLRKLYEYSACSYKSTFGIRARHRTGLRGGEVVAELPAWFKTHSRNQARYAAAKIYNTLPELVRRIFSKAKFRKKTQRDHYWYLVNDTYFIFL